MARWEENLLTKETEYPNNRQELLTLRRVGLCET